MHVLVFAYGTIRTDPRYKEVMNCSDSELSDYGQLDIQLNWDPAAELIGDLGGWELRDRAMFCDGGVPAVSDWPIEGAFVIGDLYRVTMQGFQELLRYEGYPSLYGFEVLNVVSRGPGVREIVEAVVFTTSRAEQFGERVATGDYFTPSRKEIRCAE